MSFAVRFYTFSKKSNSTARPSSSYTEYDCRLKAPSGMLHPVIELGLTANYPNAFNYAYIPGFGRYYYINEWTLEPGNIWTASMDVDALATWKNQIGGQSFYVLRASAAHDGLVKDTMYPTRATYTYSINAGNAGSWWDISGTNALSSGYYVVGVLSYSNSLDVVGGLNYIAMTPTSFNNFLTNVFSVSNADAYMAKGASAVQAVFSGASLTSDEVANLAYIVENPFTDYIKSITWVPSAPVISGTAGPGLYLGPNFLDDFVYSSIAVKDTALYTTRFTVPQHPKAGTRGKYLNTEPFTEYYLKLPKMGLQPVPGDLFANKTYLHVTLQIDPITGEGMYTLLTSDTGGLVNAIEVARWYAQIGVQVQIAQTKDVGERAQAISNVVGLGLSTLSNPGSLTQLPAAIGDIVKSRNASGETIGQAGGWLGLGGNNGQPYLIAIFHDVVDDDNAQNGRPLCAVRTPSSLGGYMMIQDADVSIAGSDEERQTIKENMESGFYYE